MKDMSSFRTPFTVETNAQGDAESNPKASAIDKKAVEDFSSEMGRKDRLISEKTSDMISVTTFSLTPAYVYVSPSHKSLLGYDAKDLLGKNPFDLIHPDDVKQLQPLLAHHVGLKDRQCPPPSEKSVTEKLLYRLKDKFGKWRYLETTGDLLD